jgi:hypothetical protein
MSKLIHIFQTFQFQSDGDVMSGFVSAFQFFEIFLPVRQRTDEVGTKSRISPKVKQHNHHEPENHEPEKALEKWDASRRRLLHRSYECPLFLLHYTSSSNERRTTVAFLLPRQDKMVLPHSLFFLLLGDCEQTVWKA